MGKLGALAVLAFVCPAFGQDNPAALPVPEIQLPASIGTVNVAYRSIATVALNGTVTRAGSWEVGFEVLDAKGQRLPGAAGYLVLNDAKVKALIGETQSPALAAMFDSKLAIVLNHVKNVWRKAAIDAAKAANGVE